MGPNTFTGGEGSVDAGQVLLRGALKRDRQASTLTHSNKKQGEENKHTPASPGPSIYKQFLI